MHAATDRLEFAPPPTPGLLRSLALAVLAHAFLLAALTWGVHWKSDAVSVTAEAELWSAVPQAAAPKLVEVPPEPVVVPASRTPLKPPVATPAPKPPPPAPEAQPNLPDPNIALEREKLRKKKDLELKKQQALDKQRLEKQRLDRLKLEELKQEKLQLEKNRLQDKRESDKKVAEDKKKAAQEAQRKANIERMTGLAGASGAPSARGAQLQSSGPSASYAGRIRALIKPNIVFADDIAGNPAAEVEVRTSPDGTIISRKLTKPSGIKSWNEAVLRAIDKTDVLPRDVDGRVISPLTIIFTPKD